MLSRRDVLEQRGQRLPMMLGLMGGGLFQLLLHVWRKGRVLDSACNIDARADTGSEQMRAIRAVVAAAKRLVRLPFDRKTGLRK